MTANISVPQPNSPVVLSGQDPLVFPLSDEPTAGRFESSSQGSGVPLDSGSNGAGNVLSLLNRLSPSSGDNLSLSVEDQQTLGAFLRTIPGEGAERLASEVQSGQLSPAGKDDIVLLAESQSAEVPAEAQFFNGIDSLDEFLALGSGGSSGDETETSAESPAAIAQLEAGVQVDLNGDLLITDQTLSAELQGKLSAFPELLSAVQSGKLTLTQYSDIEDLLETPTTAGAGGALAAPDAAGAPVDPAQAQLEAQARALAPDILSSFQTVPAPEGSEARPTVRFNFDGDAGAALKSYGDTKLAELKKEYGENFEGFGGTNFKRAYHHSDDDHQQIDRSDMLALEKALRGEPLTDEEASSAMTVLEWQASAYRWAPGNNPKYSVIEDLVNDEIAPVDGKGGHLRLTFENRSWNNDTDHDDWIKPTLSYVTADGTVSTIGFKGPADLDDGAGVLERFKPEDILQIPADRKQPLLDLLNATKAAGRGDPEVLDQLISAVSTGYVTTSQQFDIIDLVQGQQGLGVQPELDSARALYQVFEL